MKMMSVLEIVQLTTKLNKKYMMTYEQFYQTSIIHIRILICHILQV